MKYIIVVYMLLGITLNGVSTLLPCCENDNNFDCSCYQHSISILIKDYDNVDNIICCFGNSSDSLAAGYNYLIRYAKKMLEFKQTFNKTNLSLFRRSPLTLRIQGNQQQFTIKDTKDIFSLSSDLNILVLIVTRINLKLTTECMQTVPMLRKLTLAYAELSLDEKYFIHNQNLTFLDLCNSGIELPGDDNKFEGLINLHTLLLRDNKIRSLNNNTFVGLGNLKILDLSLNMIERIEKHSLDHLKNLEILDLMGNRLKTISEGVFVNNQLIIEINLSRNRIEELPNHLFANLSHLKSLILSQNDLSIIPKNLFSVTNKKHLFDCIFLSLNNFSYVDLSILNHTKALDLSNNPISYVPDLRGMNIQMLQLGGNSISSLNLQQLIESSAESLELNNSSINNIEFPSKEFITSYNRSAPLNLDLINIIVDCDDCKYFKLLLYCQNKLESIKSLIQIESKLLYCKNNVQLENYRLETLKCPITVECPTHCNCSLMPASWEILVNCSSKNLMSIPSETQLLKLAKLEGFNRTLVEDYGGVFNSNRTIKFILDLSNNLIESISEISSHIKSLNLSGNRITTLNHQVFQTVNNSKTLEKLDLRGNPLDCDFNRPRNLRQLLLQNIQGPSHKRVIEIDDTIFCKGKKISLIEIDELYHSSRADIVIIILFTLLIFIALLFILYYRFQIHVKSFLYAHKLCLCLVQVDDKEQNKMYDIFLTYGNGDEKFVSELLPQLENRQYRVCTYPRDWICGESIHDQIVSSIKSSKRTLIVLSDNFLNSRWAEMEFRVAHTEALAQNHKVILLLYKDIDESKLDSELASYYKSNTYLKWGSFYFWTQMEYVLPHLTSKNTEPNINEVRNINSNQLDSIKVN